MNLKLQLIILSMINKYSIKKDTSKLKEMSFYF